MIAPEILEYAIRILFVCVIITAAFLISSRNISSLISLYAVQSLLLAAIALLLYGIEGKTELILIAMLTIASKVIVIPYFIRHIQRKIQVSRDITFRYIQPAGALILSILLIIVVFLTFSRLLQALFEESVFFFGAVFGVSLMLMGLLATVSRKKMLTKMLGYLSMENGVLLFGLFVTELPFIIELLIIVDLIILVLLTVIMAIGIDSSLEDYDDRLRQYHIWSRQEVQE